MKLTSAEKYLNDCLKKDYTIDNKTINLSKLGWSFAGFDKAVRRGGITKYRPKHIGLSKVLSEKRSDAEVKNTVLHEVAHALDYSIRNASGHDYTWKKIATSIGCNGERCFDIDETLKSEIYKYVVECSKHGIIGSWTRKPKYNTYKCKCCGETVTVKTT